ncbi:hypothetical protein CRUP_012332 [Coryphaenoides rupestris]|nr:hypothetical protein CRUP_012332 [Coryphaenoides rupestris]
MTGRFVQSPGRALPFLAHQLVLPPCEVVIKAVSEYVSSIKDLGNLDAIARDVFKQSQSRMEDKVERFKKAVEYFSAASKPRTLNMGPSFILPGFGPNPFGGPPGHMGPMQPGKNQFPAPQVPGLKPPYQNAPYGPGSNLVFQNQPPLMPDCNDSLAGKMPFTDWSAPYDSNQGGNRLPNHHAGAPSAPSPSPPSSSDGDEPNDTNAKHRRGLMYPQIYHILTKGEMKMPVCIEDECNSELPPASLLFRAARQYSYGVLFSLAETHRRLERLAMRKRGPVEGLVQSDALYSPQVRRPVIHYPGPDTGWAIGRDHRGALAFETHRCSPPPPPPPTHHVGGSWQGSGINVLRRALQMDVLGRRGRPPCDFCTAAYGGLFHHCPRRTPHSAQ